MNRLDSLKETIRKEASNNPEKFFATKVIKEKGFTRAKCTKCDKYFWSKKERDVCGDPECSDGYTFINNSPTDKEYSYFGIWKKYKKFMRKRGYKPIKRYPVIARWRDDVEFVNASIYNFQPHVVSGEVEPPAKELIVPQPSLRFNDIDNVGVTGRHYVLHVHIGQHAFRKSNEYKQNKYFKDMFEWATKGLGIPEEKLVLHEDSWGGGGNLGACMEFFVDGLELWNQVYMFYEIEEDGYKELDLKVLDMGMGHERITWISQGKSTSYECVMPNVVNKLYDITGLKPDSDLWQQFLPFSSYLNIDEVDDINKTWRLVAEKIGVDVKTLKSEIMPVSALYSVAEHARALLFALNDGKLPSNTKGGHNLRVIARRAMGFIDEYEWDVRLADIAEWHAEELNKMYPELIENIENVKNIIDVERKKYENNKKNTKEIIKGLKKDDIGPEKLIELYDSKGISPQTIKKMYDIEIPQNFYNRVTQKHEKEEKAKTKKKDINLDTSGINPTETIYYKKKSFKAKIIKTLNDYVVLDKTSFYPTSGGQMHDTGHINGKKVIDVIKKEGVIFHKVPEHDFKTGQKVKAEINKERRKQITQHHSATHVVNKVARDVLGDHIWQAGAYKDTKKARLDITHFELPSNEELEEIERKANEMVKQGIPVKKKIIEKKQAEKKYGFRIYQGGIIPGNKIRVVEIKNVDIEACGGTHVKNTKEIGDILVKNAKKIQDGVVRLEITAGKRTKEFLEEMHSLAKECAELLDCEIADLPQKTMSLFQRWKKIKKDVETIEKKKAERITEKLNITDIDNKKIIIDKIPGANMKELKKVSEQISSKNSFVMLFGVKKDIIYVFGSRGDKIDIDMGGMSQTVFSELDGKGGGSKKTCQGVVKNKEKLDHAIERLESKIINILN